MAENKNQDKPTRRAFLDKMLEGMVVAGAGVALYPLVKYAIPPKQAEGQQNEVEATTVDQLGPGKALKFEFHGQPAMVINVKTGFKAVSAVCTHLGCIVDWDESKLQIICPCHNAVFDYNGNIVSGPPPLPLEQLEANVRDNKIMVRKKG